MPIAQDYTPSESSFPLAGLDLLSPTDQVDHHYSPNAKNAVCALGVVSKRTGYNPLGTSQPPDPVMALIDFEVTSTNRIFVCITTTKFYSYDPGGNVWVDRTKQAMSVDVPWTGTQDNPVSWVVAEGLDGSDNLVRWIIATNGKDTPQYWDGSASKFADWPINLPGFVTCGCLASFYNHLFIGDISTGSHDEQQIAWGNAGSLIDFTAANGDEGVNIITDAVGPIRRLVQMGDRLMLYADDTIHAITYLGGSFIFSFELIATQTRLVGPNAVVNLGPYHLFMSQEDIVLFDGSRMLRPVSANIRKLYRVELLTEQRLRAWGFLDQPHRFVFWGVPTPFGFAVYQQEFDLFNPGSNVWSRNVFTDQASMMGFYTRDDSRRWNSLPTRTWKQATASWASEQARKGFPVRVLGAVTGAIMLCDGSSSDDNGKAVEAFWDTSDYTASGSAINYTGPTSYVTMICRWVQIEFEAAGTSVDIYTSRDRGQSYQFVKTVALTSVTDRYQVQIDTSSRTLRVRFYTNALAQTFSFNWCRCWFQPGGSW